MQKPLSGLAATVALGLFVSAGQACDWHRSHVTASTETTSESVAMSTYDGATTPPAVEEETTAEAAPQCADGQAECTPTHE
jgi:hypothetical protein